MSAIVNDGGWSAIDGGEYPGFAVGGEGVDSWSQCPWEGLIPAPTESGRPTTTARSVDAAADPRARGCDRSRGVGKDQPALLAASPTTAVARVLRALLAPRRA